MNQLKCEVCGGEDFIKQGGIFVCQPCGVKYNVEEARKVLSGEGTYDEDDDITIPIVELFDENGVKAVFELLDTVDFEGNKYTALTPYYETIEEYDLESPADLFIFKEIVDKKTGEPLLETVEDENLLQSVYSIFKNKHAGELKFEDVTSPG